jgi:hypothetical protein
MISEVHGEEALKFSEKRIVLLANVLASKASKK